MDKKLVTAKLILQVGSLQFMEAEGSYIFGKSDFFWKFKDSTTIYGPFPSLLEAGEHVDALLRGPTLPAPAPSETIAEKMLENLTKEETPNNIISVDFIGKRRL